MTAVEKVIADWHEPVATREARPMTSDGKNVRIEERREPARDPLHNAAVEKQKVDENKQAFARVAEEFRQKEREREANKQDNKEVQKEKQPVSNIPQERSEGHKPKVQSPTDQHAAKKNPSKENVSHLKNALADVLQKAKTETKDDKAEKVEVKPAPNPLAKAHEKTTEKPVEKPVEKIAEKEAPKKEEKKREVPEDVLKKLLSMDDAK